MSLGWSPKTSMRMPSIVASPPSERAFWTAGATLNDDQEEELDEQDLVRTRDGNGGVFKV